MARIPVILTAHHIARGHTSRVYTPHAKLNARLPHISIQYMIMFLVHGFAVFNMGTVMFALWGGCSGAGASTGVDSLTILNCYTILRLNCQSCAHLGAIMLCQSCGTTTMPVRIQSASC